ncbi:MAG: lactonase family protein [Betaproteobacteria bacterium]
MRRLAALLLGFFPLATMAGTFVYVSNADDGDIGVYTLQSAGTLQPGARVPAAKVVMPMAVSPDKRYLYAAVRSKPYAAHSFSIDPKTGALKAVGTGTLAESFPYISTDRTGRYLLGASYGAHLVSVNPISGDGKVGDPLQTIPIGRNAHSIRVDNTNRYVFVPTLGSDEIFQFVFDPSSGRLTSNTPSVVLLKQPGTGPRHLIVSSDNRFVYVLNELVGTVTRFSLDATTGLLTEQESVSVLPADSKLQPGMPRGAVGTPGANQAPRNTDNDIWASDVHLRPDGKFMYAAERTSNTIATLRVDGATGKLTYVASAPTEPQPRGFAIDPSGQYLVASGEKSETISVYSIDGANGTLKLLKKYPTGKGSNWVEIVATD